MPGSSRVGYAARRFRTGVGRTGARRPGPPDRRSFEKDGRSIAYRRVHLTDAGEALDDTEPMTLLLKAGGAGIQPAGASPKARKKRKTSRQAGPSQTGRPRRRTVRHSSRAGRPPIEPRRPHRPHRPRARRSRVPPPPAPGIHHRRKTARLAHGRSQTAGACRLSASSATRP